MSNQAGDSGNAEEREAGPMLEGAGPAWPELPKSPPRSPRWVNARAFPAVWREMWTFTVGGLNATAEAFPQMRPGVRWNHRPEPDTHADVEQAIAAKIHLGMRTLPLLALLGPEELAAVRSETAARGGRFCELGARGERAVRSLSGGLDGEGIEVVGEDCPSDPGSRAVVAS